MPGRGNGNRGGGNPQEDQHGRSQWSPGHQKREAGAQSARDYAPGHDGDMPGQVDRDAGESAVERPEADSLDREG